LTVTPATAGIAKVDSNEERRKNFLTAFLHTTEEKVFKNPP
jgi:hypothetical protein